MFSEIQKVTGKAMVFLQKKALSALYIPKQKLHMAMNNTTAPKVRLLYDLCKTTFTPSGLSSSPSPQPIHKLCSLLGIFHYCLFLFFFYFWGLFSQSFCIAKFDGFCIWVLYNVVIYVKVRVH